MAYDLRTANWIAWRRRSGIVEWGTPSLLTDRGSGDTDPIVALATPRADFDGALHEFLVGLLAAALAPNDESEWLKYWKNPPSPDDLRAALESLPDAFDLEHEVHPFLQDSSEADFAVCEVRPIDQLLIDSPGDQGISLNKDLFVKRARFTQLGRPAAAMALITMQTYAPSGGQGHRTSMRGGGPLTTLVDPRIDEQGGWLAHARPLWEKLWANVETEDQLRARTPPDTRPLPLERAFPWLGSTRTSNPKKGGTPTTPKDGHPLQAYFGMPRRIRLSFGGPGNCELTSLPDDVVITGFRAVNYGVEYEKWEHPLSPYYRVKPSERWLPVHAQSDGFAWRDWLSLAMMEPTGELRRPAQCVAAFNPRASRIKRREVRVHAFGYDMDNMKTRGWSDAIMPAFAIAAPDRRRDLYAFARHLTEATSLTNTALLGAVKTALFHRPNDAPGDLDQVRLDLWNATESAFYAALRRVAGESDSDTAAARGTSERHEFLSEIRDAALAVFDHWVPAGPSDVDALRRRVRARYALTSVLRGYGKLGESVFAALDLPVPEPAGSRKSGRKPRTNKAAR